MDGIFEIENDRVRTMQRCVDEIFWLRAGKIEARAAQPIFRRRFGQGNLFRRGLAPKAQASTFGCGLDPRRNDERECPLVVDSNARMLDPKRLQHLPGRCRYGIAIVRRNARTYRDLEAPALP